MSRSTVVPIEVDFQRYKAVGEGAFEQLGPEEIVEAPETMNSMGTTGLCVLSHREVMLGLA